MPQYIGSTTPLGAGATYTSPWTLSDFWANISGTIFADQAGNLLIDQSADGVNTGATTTQAVVASTAASFNVVLVSRYVRVRMTNTAGSAQTVLRLDPRFIPGTRP